MKSRKKGLKRHEVLQPLSRHHMIALHLSLKLRRIGTEKSTLTAEELKQEVKNFWEPEGERHFREEEEILLPTYSKYGSIDDRLIIEMLLEHVQIRALVHDIMDAPTPDVQQLKKLGTLIEQHVRKEERVIFPMIEKALPETVMQKMAPYIRN